MNTYILKNGVAFCATCGEKLVIHIKETQWGQYDQTSDGSCDAESFEGASDTLEIHYETAEYFCENCKKFYEMKEPIRHE